MRAVKITSNLEPPRVNRTDRRRIETTSRLVAAAVELFSIHGFDGTTMDMIADAADVARTTVFNHFARKDLLLLTALADHRRVVGDRLSASVGLPTDARIRDAVTGWARSYQSDAVTGSGLVRAWVHAGGPYLAKSTDTAALFGDVLAAGRMRAEVNPQIAGLALMDACIGALVRWAAGPPTRRRPGLARSMLAAADLILAGALPASK